MERYGKFYGCDKTGRYETLLYARELDMLMARCGAKNPGAAVDAAINPLCSFQLFSQYSDNKQDEYPVSLCYIPRHLSKLDAFREMNEPVYAVAVNGFEHKARDTNYSCAVLVSRQEMLSDGAYNYLDQIFGTPLVSWQEMYLLREKGVKPDVNMTPVKVTPVLKSADQAAICAVVDALYADKKHIFICLEQGRTFNKRSVDLLTQIYSLLPPRLAIETGFVTYQPVAKVQELIAATGIKISVYPAEAAATLPAPTDGTLVLDLNRPETVQVNPKSKVVKGVMWWAGLTWDQRREAMAKLFADRSIALLDPEKYVEITAAFAQNDLLTGKMKNASFPDVESIRKAYENDPILSKNISWVTEVFLSLLKAKGKDIRAMKGEVIAQAKVADLRQNKELLNHYLGQYEFLSKLLPEDSAVAALNSAVGPITQIQKEADAAAINAAKEEVRKKEQELAVIGQRHQEELAVKEQNHQKALSQQDQLHRDELAKKDGQMQTMTQKHAQDIDTLKGEHETAMTNLRAAQVQKVNEINAAHTAEVATLNAAAAQLTTDKETAERNLANARNLLEQERQNHVTAMEQAQAEQRTAVFNAKAELNQQHQQEKAQMEAHYAAEKRNAEREHASQLEQERSRADLAERRAASVQRRLDAVLGGESIPEDLDLVEEEETNHGNGGKRRFDKDAPKMDMKILAIVAAACLLVGALLGAVIGGLLFGGGKDEETLPTEPPVTTIAPVETTQPVETTLPEETTVPTVPETTAPPETTEPEETTEPTAPGEVAKPEIDWTTVPETTGLAVVETNETNMENLLSRFVTDVDVKPVAIVTVDAVGFVDGNGVRILPDEFAVLLEKTGEDATVEPNPEDKLLETEAALIMESTHYRLVIVGDQKMQEAAMKLFALAVPAEDSAVTLTVVKEDGTALTLSQLLDEVLDEEPWWSAVTDVSVETTVLRSGKALTGSRLEPVAAINCGLTRTIYIYDYAGEEAGKAQEFADVQKNKGNIAVALDLLVAVACEFAQG